MRVIDLIPGTVMEDPRDPAVTVTYIAQTVHPLYRGLQLVIWRMPDGSISLDALNPAQVLVGRVRAQTAADITASLRKAIHPA